MEKNNSDNERWIEIISGKNIPNKNNEDELYASLIRQSLITRQTEIENETKNLTQENFKKIQNKLITEGILNNRKENEISLINQFFGIFTKIQSNNVASLGVGIAITATLIILYLAFPRFENKVNTTDNINYQRNSTDKNKEQEDYEEIIKLEPLKNELKNKRIDFKLNNTNENYYVLIINEDKESMELLHKYDIMKKSENGKYIIFFK